MIAFLMGTQDGRQYMPIIIERGARPALAKSNISLNRL
jgi:hypothetical protein